MTYLLWIEYHDGFHDYPIPDVREMAATNDEEAKIEACGVLWDSYGHSYDTCDDVAKYRILVIAGEVEVKPLAQLEKGWKKKRNENRAKMRRKQARAQYEKLARENGWKIEPLEEDTDG